MTAKRKRHKPEVKAQVALEAYKGDKTINQLASEHEVAAVQVSQWKRQLLQGGPEVFGRTRPEVDPDALTAPLYQEIGRLKMELDWLKKNLAMSIDDRRKCIEPSHPEMSIQRQCELIGLNRSSWYYQATPAQENTENLYLMRLIDEQYTRAPFYGSRKITAWLNNQGHPVNRKRIQRLMGLMGIQGVAPSPGTSVRNKEHKVYPYLLRGVDIVRPNQVWSTDITYCPMPQGFMYLVAIIDWYSRYVISWELSNTLDFLAPLQEREIRISMDGKGRALDNIFVERLWRSVKYEWLYMHEFRTVPELRAGLDEYFEFYNVERLHQSLGYKTPQAIHFA